MKLIRLILLSQFMCITLFAQTILPDLEIRGDARIRLPLSKRPLGVSVMDSSDSLAVFLPRISEPVKSIQQSAKPLIRSYRFTMELAPTLATELSATAYGIDKRIPHARARINLTRVQSRWFDQQWELYGQTKLINGVPFQHQIQYRYTRNPDYYSEAFAFENSFSVPDARIQNIRISEFNTAFSYQVIDQVTESIPMANSYFDVSHSHSISYNGHSLENSIEVVSGKVGLSSSYKLLLTWLEGIETDLGLMTNLMHLSPYLKVSKAFWIRPDLYFRVSNAPSVVAHDRSDLMEKFPWAAQPDNAYMGILPLNVNVAIGKGNVMNSLASSRKPIQSNDIVSEVYLKHNVRYEYHRPTICEGIFTSVPSLMFADVLQNFTTLGAQIRYGKVSFMQDLSMNMGHLPEFSYKPIPYEPLMKAQTVVRVNIQGVDTQLSLDQGYWMKDHKRKNLPAVFDLSARAYYQLNPVVSVYAKLENIFHTPNRQWNSIPGQGRNIQLGFQYIVR